MTDSKRHLIGRRAGYTACGIRYGVEYQGGADVARAVTNIPGAVTCKGCAKTTQMADAEIRQQQQRRSLK